MSVEATSAVWAYRGGKSLASGARLVLLRLADVAHPDGTNAFLAVATIATDCDLDRSTVQRNLRWLEDNGLIKVQHEATNRRPTVYRLTLPGLRRVEEPVDVGAANDGPKVVPLRPQNAAPDESLGPRRGRVGAAPTRPDPEQELHDQEESDLDQEDRSGSGSGRTDAAPTPPLVRPALWVVHKQLTGLLAPSAQDERQIDDWADMGATPEHVERALAEVNSWERRPERPWHAFRSAMGRQLSVIPEGRAGPRQHGEQFDRIIRRE